MLVRNSNPNSAIIGLHVISYNSATSAPALVGETHTTGAGPGVQGWSPPGIGVYGYSSSNWGVFGFSQNSRGIVGQSTQTGGQSIYGYRALGAGGVGVFGISDTGYGVQGDTAGGNGVVGTASTNGNGVHGTSSTGNGVAGVVTNGGTAVYGRSETPSGWGGFFQGKVQVNGDLACTGTKSAAVPHPDGQMRLMYATEAPLSMFEDFGRTRLSGGSARVAIDPDFAALVRADDYDVFLTPYGECRGLAVLDRAPDGFTIRELQAGTASIEVGYRIVARRADTNEERLVPVARVSPPELAAVVHPPDIGPELERARASDMQPPRYPSLEAAS